jgi:hypothetical protein
MVRGLSDLQRYILAEAGQRLRVYHAEVLAGFYGWRPRRPLARDAGGQLRSPGDPHFFPAQIGVARYRSTISVLSRACRSLEGRGLITSVRGGLSHWAAVEITDKGREWLAANNRAESTGG